VATSLAALGRRIERIGGSNRPSTNHFAKKNLIFLEINPQSGGRQTPMGRRASSNQGFTYRSGLPNRRHSVAAYRSVSRGNRRLPNKFKFSNPPPVQSVRERFTDRFGPVTDR
jgi:hypothetical protein